MSGEHQAEVRDRRRKGWFSVDDEVIDVYGERIGVHGIAVYSALCKRADRNQQVKIGLSWFCKKLKIGREKLIKTLALLDELDLIETEPGDRANVSVYTLLDVKKAHEGGSNENQGVVLTRTRGGSNQNQGGSNENHPYIENQTQDTNKRIKEGAAAHATGPLPDNATGSCLLLLKKVMGIGKDYGELALLVAELREEFPEADPVEVCRDYEFKHRHGLKTKNHPNRLRQFFRTANSGGVSSRASPDERAGGVGANGNAGSGKEARNGADRQSAAGYTEGYEFLFSDD